MLELNILCALVYLPSIVGILAGIYAVCSIIYDGHKAKKEYHRDSFRYNKKYDHS